MAKRRPKHDKSRDRRNYTYHPKRTFSLRWDPEPGPCYLFALDERQAAMLRKMCQVFPKYHYIWGLPTPQADWDQATTDLWNEIEAFVDETEACLVSGCDLNEWLKQQRMLTAAIIGESVDLTDPAQLSPDAVDYSESSATPGLVPSLRYLQNLQTLGTIPGSGDTVQQTLWDIRDGMTDGGKTLDEWITEMQAQEALDPDNYGFKDWLEMLLLVKQLVPNLGVSPLAWVLEQYRTLLATRHAHTHSTLMAYQATELRAIRNALAPFEPETDGEGNVTEDEESLVKSIISDLDQIPWLTTAIGALVDPSPSGETALAIKIGLAAKNLWDKLTSLYQDWMNLYINQVETLQPRLTVSGMIAEISKRIRGDNEDYGSTDEPATIFGALQTLAWTQVSPQDEVDNPGISTSNQLKAIADSLAALDADMPEGSTWPALMGQIAANIANIKLSCNCGGGGGGCGACGGGDLPSEPATEGGIPPDGWIEPTDSAGNPVTPGSPEYQSRKCKIANIIHENVVDFLTRLNDAGIMEVLGTSVALVVVTTMVFAVFAEVATPVPLIDGLLGGVAGAVASLSIVFLVNTVDLAELISILNANEEDLVCALYNANSTSGAATDYQAIVQNDPNFTIGANVLILEALLLTNFVNVLFFDPSNYSDTLPSQLDGYTGPVDCSACEEAVPPLFPFDADLEGWYLVETDPAYPGLPNTNQTLVWQDHAAFPSQGEAIASSADGESCYISSPIVNYYLDPSQSHTFEWNRKASNVTYRLSLWMSDASEVILEGDGTGYPDGQNSHNLDAYHGQTVRTIELSFGAGVGNRDFIIDYVNITSV